MKLRCHGVKANGQNWKQKARVKRLIHTHGAAHRPTHALIFQPLQIVRCSGDNAEVISSPLCQSPTENKNSKVGGAAHIYAGSEISASFNHRHHFE